MELSPAERMRHNLAAFTSLTPAEGAALIATLSDAQRSELAHLTRGPAVVAFVTGLLGARADARRAAEAKTTLEAVGPAKPAAPKADAGPAKPKPKPIEPKPVGPAKPAEPKVELEKPAEKTK